MPEATPPTRVDGAECPAKPLRVVGPVEQEYGESRGVKSPSIPRGWLFNSTQGHQQLIQRYQDPRFQLPPIGAHLAYTTLRNGPFAIAYLQALLSDAAVENLCLEFKLQVPNKESKLLVARFGARSSCLPPEGLTRLTTRWSASAPSVL